MMINFLFVACSLYLLVQAFRLMSGAWNLNTPEVDPTKPVVTKKTITKPVHPEMVDVKPGDELMGVTFAKIPPPTSDPLHESLRKRITELTPDPWIDEEDDDDGGAPVPARR